MSKSYLLIWKHIKTGANVKQQKSLTGLGLAYFIKMLRQPELNTDNPEFKLVDIQIIIH